MSHWGFHLHFLMPDDTKHLFMLICHSCTFFREVSSCIFCSWSELDCRVFIYSGYWFRCVVCKYFLLVSSLSFHARHLVCERISIFNFEKVQFINFTFCGLGFWCQIWELCASPQSWRFSSFIFVPKVLLFYMSICGLSWVNFCIKSEGFG